MAIRYEAWRISFQSSEQAARVAWRNWQQEAINYALEQDDFLEYQKEAEALIEKLASAIQLINPSMDFAGWENGYGEPIGDLLNEAVSAYNAWKEGHA